MANSLPGYAELVCTSNYSFLTGASHPEEYVDRAVELGYAGLAIADECTLAGVVRAHVAAKAVGLPLMIASQFRLDHGPRVVLIARSRKGYGDLSELITLARRRAEGAGGRLFAPLVLSGEPVIRKIKSCLRQRYFGDSASRLHTCSRVNGLSGTL